MHNERGIQGTDVLLRSSSSQNYGFVLKCFLIYICATFLGVDCHPDPLFSSFRSTSNFSSRSSLYNEYVSSPPCCPQFCVVSHVRRTFCLIVTFDVLLSFLLWSIFVKVSGLFLKSSLLNLIYVTIIG